MRLDDEPSTPAPRALAIGVTALACFVLLGAALSSPAIARLDLAVQRWALAAQAPWLHGVALGVTIAGGIVGMRVLAVAAAAWLWRRMGWVAAIAMAATPLVAELLADVGKHVYARPRPAGLGHGVDVTWAFPSAHATVSTATGVMLAWLGWRGGLLAREVALTFAVAVPLLVGASRVLLNVHWATDVLGGWCEGVAIATLSIASLCCARCWSHLPSGGRA